MKIILIRDLLDYLGPRGHLDGSRLIIERVKPEDKGVYRYADGDATADIPVSNQRESRFSRILENYLEISLLDLDLEAFSFHFSFSISISMYFHFTFHSRKEWKENKIHFSFLKKSENISDFTLFLEKKEWN